MHRKSYMAAALVAVLALSACHPSRTGYGGPAGASRLDVLGHSIPTSARSELQASLGRARRVAFDTHNGRTIAQASPSIDWAVRERPGVVVVDLGDNELGTGHTQAQLRRLTRATLDRLVGVPCVVWVDIGDQATPFYRTDWEAQAEAFNKWLAAEASGRANTHVAAWADQARPNGEWFLADRLHLNGAGRAAYAAFVASEVDSFCGGPVTSVPDTTSSGSPRARS